ncbi:DedA family protein [Paenibacillus cookii]|uniref:Membrane protein YbfM n=1 Tax=Paenibacillus cookii TaxID=157839 RepID=A0ABQ4M0L0_9BACL|nr:DedA family protein [Paenibacillus cookii]KHF37427.1 Inner membrane protein YabI [Paenibacillus sp. P1XP2]GIO69054.1 putative membrane protein YbfM [Paenibacillus cookii]
MTEIMVYLTQYGYIALFVLLALGIVGVPVPDETLIAAFGGMIAQGHFHFAVALAVTFTGSMTGMMISYALGRKVGKPLLERYGKWVRLTPGRLKSAEAWFKRYGAFSIVIGYFIPGLRHLSSYMAGISKLPVGRYAAYAALGALLFCSTFLLIGHAVGYHWNEIAIMMQRSSLKVGVLVTVLLVAMLAVAGFVWRRRR